MARPDTWFRMYAEVVDDPKVQQLPDKLFKIWVNLLCVATRSGGVLPSYDDVAFKLRITPAKAKEHVETFLKRALFDRTEGGIAPHNWNARQYKSDVSTDRVKRFRNSARNVSEAVSETPTEQSRAKTEKNHPSDGMARAPKPVKGTRLALDWRPCEEARAYARNLGLGDGEIQAEANEFREYFTGKDCAKPVKRDWLAAWQRWVRNNAPKRIRNRPRGPAARGASPTAARDSILAKAGIRRGEAGFVHPDPECGASRGIAGEASSGTVIDADGWREVPGSADGDETADTPQPGIDGGLGGTARCLPQAADGIPGGRGVLRADDAAGNLAVVAGMGGTEGAVGGFDAPEEADAGGSDLDIPAFLDRRHKLSA